MSIKINNASKLELDGSKIAWHQDRLKQWIAGERFAPITIDMALTRSCNYNCQYCYGKLQENKRQEITFAVMRDFLDDCADLGVKAISLVSDGESTVNPCYVDSIKYGKSKGIDMAMGTNGYLLNEHSLNEILPCLTYLRFNISAGEPKRYAEIHGVSEKAFDRVCQNIKDAVRIKKERGLSVTIGMQMVLLPEYEDQILPLAKLAKALRPDYLVIKHCSDDESGSLGVDYGGYSKMYDTLRLAETFSDNDFDVVVKWSKISSEGKRTYERCYGPPFHLQVSGSGLVAPCGGLFADKYSRYHIGNFVTERFKDIVMSQKYWDIMRELSSERFNAKTMCACLCLQHKTNEVLDAYKNGEYSLDSPLGEPPQHINFI